MHRIIETDPLRPEMHPGGNRGRLQFGRGREYDGSRNSMIRQIARVPYAVARFVMRFLRRGTYPCPHQRMLLFDDIPGLRHLDWIVLQPVTLSLERIGGQRYTTP